jgi:hypothetical protein
VERSSRVLGFVVSLCGLNLSARYKLEQAVWAISRNHPNREDDIIQEMALQAWTNHLFGRGTNTGELIAAGNRGANERR